MAAATIRTTAVRVAARALPNLLVAAVIPAVCFLVGRRLWGLGGAIALNLVWNGSCQVIRRCLGKPLSGLLLLGSIGLVVRAAVALALNSPALYFITPAVITGLTGVVYMASGVGSSRLLARVLADLVPDTVLDVNDARFSHLLRAASVLYGAEQFLISVVSIVMVVNLSTTAYVAVHPFVSWAVLALVVGLAIPFFKAEVLQAAPGRRLALTTGATQLEVRPPRPGNAVVVAGG